MDGRAGNVLLVPRYDTHHIIGRLLSGPLERCKVPIPDVCCGGASAQSYIEAERPVGLSVSL